MMSFKSPWLLLGLLVLAAGGRRSGSSLDRRRARYAVRYTNLDVLATVVSGRSWPRYVPAALLVLGLTCAVRRPRRGRRSSARCSKERATVILVVDTSRSMQAEDVAPTRLGAAQEAIRTFLDQAPDDLRVGLVVFAGEAQVATPPTKDHQLVDTAVDRDRPVPRLRGNRDRRRAPDCGRARQAGDRRGTERRRRDRSAPASSTRRARWPRRAVAVPRRRAPSRSSSSPTARRREASCSRSREPRSPEACFPVYTVALGTPEGVIERGPFGGIPGAAGHGPADSRASRPRDAPRDREDDGRRVLRGAHGRRARASVREPRLAARPRARSERGHVAVRRARGRAPGLRRARGDVRLAATAVATRPRS